jgi:hypothetical protein
MASRRRVCAHCNTVFALPKEGGTRFRCPGCGKRVTPRYPVAAPVAPGPTIGPALEFTSRRRSYEFPIALAIIAAISAWYFLTVPTPAPVPSSGLGWTLGIVGFLLMLATETLYSLRKHVRRFTVGRMNVWLQAHIVTGLVGPYLVVLHAAGKYQGLAGILLVLMLVMVASGFVGRYIYTAVPRANDGSEAALRDLEAKLEAADRRLEALGVDVCLADEPPSGRWLAVLARPVLLWRTRRRLRAALDDSDVDAAEFESLCVRRARLQFQIDSLIAGRRLLALWHLFHVPLGVVVFSLAFIHVAAAIYYTVFLR